MSGILKDANYKFRHLTASATLKPEDNGKIVTNLGAGGAVVMTTPKFTEIWDGWSIKFVVAADNNFTATAGDADTIVTFNDAAADSVAFSTSSKKLGGAGELVADVTNSKWYHFGNMVNTATDGTTQHLTTIAT